MRMCTPIAAFAFIAVAWSGIQPARADDPSKKGSYLVRSETVSARIMGGTTPVEVILPSGASFARPVVLVLHGWMAPTLIYEGIAHHLASRGFAAVLFQQPNFYSNDMQSWTNNTRDAISELIRLNGDPKCPFFGELDVNRIGVIGHSRGGATATMIAGQDPRVKCAVGLAPANWWTPTIYNQVLAAAGKIKVPYLAIIGSSDTWLAHPTYPRNFYGAAVASPERQLIEVRGGGHLMYFGNTANDVLSTRYYTAWLERFLCGKADPQGFTTGAMGAQQLKQGVLTIAKHATAGPVAALPPPPSVPMAVLSVGSTGPDVSAVQQRLQQLGLYSGTVDGIFGDQTRAAVVAFQGKKGLTADGIVGPATRAALGLP